MSSARAIQADVAVIGGGIAGLTTAVGVARHGLRPVVIEREPILGGRARSWRDPKTGDPVDIGPHVFVSEYPNVLALLDTLGTRADIVWQHGPFCTLVDGVDVIDIRMQPRLPAPLNWFPSWNADPALSTRDRLSNVRVAWSAMRLHPDDIDVLDHHNALDYLHALGASRRSIERFWRLLSIAILNVPLHEASAGALMRLYARMIGHRNYRLGFADGALGDIFGPPAQALIEGRGGQVLTNVTASGILASPTGQARGVQLADGRAIHARFVVAAVPPDALAGLDPPRRSLQGLFRTLNRFDPSPYAATTIWFDTKLTHRQMWARVETDPDVCLNCDFYDLSNIYTGWSSRPSVITTNSIYAGRLDAISDDDIVAATVAELAETLPAAATATVTHALVRRIPFAIHCPRPGVESLRPPTRTGIEGLYLAGDWLATGLPASMESACLAGWQAADAIVADHNGTAPPMATPHRAPQGLAGLMRSRHGRHAKMRRRTVAVG